MIAPRRWTAICLLALVSLTACSSGESRPPAALAAGPDGSSDSGPIPAAAGTSGSYPSGPYGSEVGQRVEGFAFEGWRDPSAQGVDPDTLETIRFSDYYDPNGELGIRLLLLNATAGWCTNCQAEHRILPSKVLELGPRGLTVISMLYHDANFEPPGVDDLVAWAETYGTNFPFTLDLTHRMGRYGAADIAPVNVVVDARTMEILAKFIGNQEAVLWQFVETELEARAREG